MRKLTWMGINKDTYSRTVGAGNYKWMYDVEHIGFKYHGNSIMAAIGLAQIKVYLNFNLIYLNRNLFPSNLIYRRKAVNMSILFTKIKPAAFGSAYKII